MYALCRAFKSILKCQRIRQYKPSTNFYRISSATHDQFRPRRSISCDLSGGSHSRHRSSITSNRMSSDSQRHFGLSKTNRYVVNNHRRTSRHESIHNPTIRKSISAPDNTSPWHLRKPANVR